MNNIKIWALVFLMALVAPPVTPGQVQGEVRLQVDALPYSEYPSMTPVLAVRVHLSGSSNEAADLVATAVQAGWNCSSTSSYNIRVGTEKVPIKSLSLEGSGDCNDVVKPDILLVLGRHLNASDKVIVSLANLPNGAKLESAPVNFKQAQTLGLTATPQAVPSEALTNGKKRDVGQLAVSITAPDLAPTVKQFAVYAKSSDVFSTDAKDAKSAFSATLGMARGFLPAWYAPIHLEETVKGNQTADNLSAVTSVGFTTLCPWLWTRNVLNNSWIAIPRPPELTVNSDYTRRINQLGTAKTPRLAENDFDLNPSVTLAPVYVLPKVCSWIHSKSNSRQYCLGIETDIGMWYLPLDKTPKESRRAEGYGDVSLLIPLSDIPFSPLANLISSNAANFQFRIKYSDSVNSANNYARTRQWTFGVEVIK